MSKKVTVKNAPKPTINREEFTRGKQLGWEGHPRPENSTYSLDRAFDWARRTRDRLFAVHVLSYMDGDPQEYQGRQECAEGLKCKPNPEWTEEQKAAYRFGFNSVYKQVLAHSRYLDSRASKNDASKVAMLKKWREEEIACDFLDEPLTPDPSES